jgi:nucleotidyltransferase substrate binding protein (TIGR01987 family)
LEAQNIAFHKAFLSLKSILEEPYSEIVRDATIRRFEYTFDLAWKSLRLYLSGMHGILCNSPKSCFREGFKLELYDDKMTELFLQMTDERNETAHTYNENNADRIYQNIKEKYSTAFTFLTEIIHKQGS